MKKKQDADRFNLSLYLYGRIFPPFFWELS